MMRKMFFEGGHIIIVINAIGTIMTIEQDGCIISVSGKNKLKQIAKFINKTIAVEKRKNEKSRRVDIRENASNARQG